MKIAASVMLFALLTLPVVASTPSCVAEDNEAAATVQQDFDAGAVLARLTNKGRLNVSAAAAELSGNGEVVSDKVIGHIRWAIGQGGSNKVVSLYHLLLKLEVGGRADVADQYLTGLNDADPEVRIASATGLQFSPSGKRRQVGLVLVDRLAPTTSQEQEHHVVLTSLQRIASEDLKGKSDKLVAELKAARPKDIPDDLFEAWKAKTSHILLSVLGPDEALRIFRELNPSIPAEQAATVGVVQALSEYAGRRMSDMQPGERNELRDIIIPFGVRLLTRAQNQEEAHRDARIREGAVLMFPVILRGGRRPSDIKAISGALDSALRVEPEGTDVALAIADMQQVLKR